jgi:hypothetical protein
VAKIKPPTKTKERPVNLVRLATAYKFKAEDYREQGLSSAADVCESAFKDLCLLTGLSDPAVFMRKALAGEVYDVLDEWNEEEGHGLQIGWLAALASRIADRIMTPEPASLETIAASLDDHLREQGYKAQAAWAGGEDAQQLFIYCEFKKDVRKMPKEWRGVPVKVEHVGRVRPA